MKKAIALLMALLMISGCLQAMAEEPAEVVTAEAPKAASTMKMELSIDKEFIKGKITESGAAEESEGLIDPILELVDALEMTAVTADGGVQIDLGLNGKTAVSLGLEEKDGGLLIASTLFPNYMLTIPQEAIQSMVPQLTPATNSNSINTTGLFKASGNGVGAIVEAIRKINPEISFTITASPEGIVFKAEQGETYFAISMVPAEDNVLDLNVFVTAKDKPAATLRISSAQEGERTLSMDPEGKTVLSVADLQGENAAQVMAGLQTDVQMSVMQLMALPEVANVMAAYTQMIQKQMMQQMQTENGEPAAADPVPADNP